MALPPEVEASYSAIIDSILASSDLNTISAKRIRKGLQEHVGHDIGEQKASTHRPGALRDAITQLIHTRFDKFTQAQSAASAPNPARPGPGAAPAAAPTNGAAKASNGTSGPPSPKKRAAAEPSDDGSELSEAEAASPPKKKAKKHGGRSVEDEDAAFAARLQAEENGRARSTRGGGRAKKRAPPKKDGGAAAGQTTKKKTKKSATKVRSDDDSEVESGSGGEKKEKKGGFHKPFTLSAPLSELLGEAQLSRPQTVKRIWQYIKAHALQDPADKRQIRCDEPLRAVFRQDRVHMFTMNKILNQNLYPVDE